MLAKVCLKLECNQYYIDSERNPTGGIVGRTPNNERRYVNMAVTGIGTYASYTNSYGNTQNAGNKTGRTYKFNDPLPIPASAMTKKYNIGPQSS